MYGVEAKSRGSGDGLDDTERVSVSHGTFRCKRGYDLYTTTYTPAVRLSPVCLVYHHGLSDYAARHRAVLSHLCSSLGMPVYTYDAHGHGLSGPPGPDGRALILSFDHMVDDLVDFTRLHVVPAEQQQHAQGTHAAGQGGGGGGEAAAWRPRIILLGYSMGGLACILAMAATLSPACQTAPVSAAAWGGKADEAAAAAATERLLYQNGAESDATKANGVHSRVANGGADSAAKGGAAAAGGGADGRSAGGSSLYEGLMLTSSLTDPLHGSSPLMQAFKVAFVRLLSWVVPALPLFKRNPVEAGIRDPAAVAEMAADTLWYRGHLRVGTVSSLFSGCARLRRLAPSLAPVPLYVQHATCDVACSLASMRAFLARVRPRDLAMHVVEGGYHDLHHDPETPVLLGHMVAWLRKRT